MKFFYYLICILATIFSSVLTALPNFDVEGRAGGKGKSDWEFGIRGEGNNPVDTGQYNWSSGNPLNWSLSYAASTGQLNFLWDVNPIIPLPFTLRDQISATLENSTPNGLKIWMKNSKVGINDYIEIDHLKLSSNAAEYTADRLKIQGSNQFQEFIFPQEILGDFTLTGTTTLYWEENMPSRSNMQFHIASTDVKGGGVDVPEPTTYLILGALLFIAYALKLRRDRQKKSSADPNDWNL
ncbi:MAG: hypothetical protein Tsb0021_13760 [Chlamydiales bacterium]